MSSGKLGGIEPTAREIEAAQAETAAELAELANDPFAAGGDDLPPEEIEPEGENAPPAILPIDQVHGAYIAAVLEILGPDAPVVPCGSCGGYGFKPFELQLAPDTEVCPDCGGWGENLLPSHVAGQLKRMCKTCAGQGWRQLGTLAQLPAPAGERPLAPTGFYYDPLGNLVALPV